MSRRLPSLSPGDVRPDTEADSKRQRHGAVVRIGIASLIAWDFLHQRPQKFAEELASLGHTLFYIEPTDFTLGRHVLARSLAQRVPAFRQVGDRVYALRPTIYPPFKQHTNQESHNRWLAPLVTSQLRRLKLDFLLVLAPEYAPVAQALGIPYAYDHVDDTQFMEHIDTARYVADMEQLQRGSAFNVYIQGSEAACDPKGAYVPNGVDTEQFFPIDAPQHFDGVVLSNIAKWFDIDAVLASSKQLLLIGPMDIDGGSNRERFFANARPNVAWIPQVDKQVANQWLSRARVGLVPFQYQHPVLHYAMPIKILEYFLAGLPVVTYRNQGIAEQYGDMVTFFASDGSDLPLDDAIEVACKKHDAYDYRAFANQFQWRDIVVRLEERIRAVTGKGA